MDFCYHTMMSHNRTEEYQCYLTFDGDETFWLKQSDKTLSTAKLMGF